MFTRAVFIIILFINIIPAKKSDIQYTEEDFFVVEGFTKSFQINSLVFVTNETNFSIDFLKHNIHSATVTSAQLYEILNDARVKDGFLNTQTMIVSKESLNYTNIFQRLSEGYSTIWVEFANTLHSLQHFYIPINADLYTVQYTNHTVINKAYHIKPDLNITVKEIGVWERDSSIVIDKNKKFNFEGAVLKMLHFLNDECNNRNLNLYLNRVECFHQEIIEILSNKLNYRINKVPCIEKVYPYNYPNGSLSDFFIILKRGDVDISSGSYIVSKERLNHFDFAWPTFTTKSMLYIKNKKKSVWRGYIRPIHKYLWHAIICWIIGVGLFIQMFQQCREKKLKFSPSLLPDLVKSLFSSLQVFCNQGIHDIPDWYSSRILLTMSFLLAVILYEVYSGFLISFLMIDVPHIPFTGINGFFRDGTYKLITLQVGFHNYVTNKIIRVLKKHPPDVKLPSAQLPVCVEEGIQLLCNSTRLTYVEFRENVVMHEIPCKILELPYPMLHQSMGIGFPKHSPYREAITREVISLNSAGILQRMRKRLFSYKNLKEKEISNEGYVPVSFKHIVSVFFILGSGMAMACGIFVLEHLFKLLKRFYTMIMKRLKVTQPRLKKFRYEFDPTSRNSSRTGVTQRHRPKKVRVIQRSHLFCLGTSIKLNKSSQKFDLSKFHYF